MQLAVEVGGNRAHQDDALTLELPVVTQLLPNHGPHQGGQRISLIGKHFGSRSLSLCLRLLARCRRCVFL